MIKKAAGSEARECVNAETEKRGLPGESTGDVVVPGDRSLEQIFDFLSEYFPVPITKNTKDPKKTMITKIVDMTP